MQNHTKLMPKEPPFEAIKNKTEYNSTQRRKQNLNC